MTTVNQIRVNFVRRTIPRRGSFSTDGYNASMEELAVDLADFSARWNTEMYPILNSLPRGTDETRWSGATSIPDAVADGLDGDHMFVDNSASTSQDDGLFWSTTYSRPKTVRESSRDIDDRLTSVNTTLEAAIAGMSNGLTSDQWTRLGAWVNDGVSADLTTSVSYKARTGWTNLGTLTTDIFNSAGDLGSLTTSGFTLEDMITDLLTIHAGTWNSDTSSIDHSAITGVLQVSVGDSASYAQKVRGSTTNLEQDVNRLRWEIARTRIGAATTTSTSQWSTDVTDPVGSGVACLNAHINYAGNGVQDINNPHAVARQDVDDLDTEFGYNNTFTGKTALGSETPTYSSVLTVTQSVSLETAIGELDVVTGAATTHIADVANPHVVTALQVGAAVREVYDFSGHTNASAAIVITHNKGTAGVSNSTWPLVQVVDTGVGGDQGVLADEVYAYEQELGLATTDAFVNVEFIDTNIFHVYTNVLNGKIIAIF
jgi:hypothetical protein